MNCRIWGVLLFWPLSVWATTSFSFPAEPPLPTPPSVTQVDLDHNVIFTEQEAVLSESYVLQVSGSFTQDQAQSQAVQLIKAGYAAYASDNGGKEWDVYIGPSVSKTELLAIAQKVKSQFNLTAQVINYQVAWPKP